MSWGVRSSKNKKEGNISDRQQRLAVFSAYQVYNCERLTLAAKKTKENYPWYRTKTENKKQNTHTQKRCIKHLFLKKREKLVMFFPFPTPFEPPLTVIYRYTRLPVFDTLVTSIS